MAKLKISNAASMLYNIGVGFYASGILRDKSGAALYDFYKADFVTDQQKANILTICPQAIFRGAYA